MRRNMSGNLDLYKYLWPGSVDFYKLGNYLLHSSIRSRLYYILSPVGAEVSAMAMLGSVVGSNPVPRELFVQIFCQ